MSPRSTHRRRPRDGGFTIIEVVVATFVMAFGIASAIIAMNAGFRSLDTARNTTLAAQIMQSEMERIRLLSWNQVDALPASATVDITSVFSHSAGLASRFNAVRDVTTVADRNNVMKEIRITVTWTGISGLTHSRSTATRYCSNGLYDYYYTLAH